MEVDGSHRTMDRTNSASAYMLFCKERRSSITQTLPVMKASDVTALLSELWKKLPEEKKQIYREQALLFKCSSMGHCGKPSYSPDYEQRATLSYSELCHRSPYQRMLYEDSKIQLNRHSSSYHMPMSADTPSSSYNKGAESGPLYLESMAQISKKVYDIPPLVVRVSK